MSWPRGVKRPAASISNDPVTPEAVAPAIYLSAPAGAMAPRAKRRRRQGQPPPPDLVAQLRLLTEMAPTARLELQGTVEQREMSQQQLGNIHAARWQACALRVLLKPPR
jgi:hypothetical protein